MLKHIKFFEFGFNKLFMILLKLFFLKFEGECLDDVERLIKEIYDVVNTKDIRIKRCQRRKFLNQIDDVFNNENRPT